MDGDDIQHTTWIYEKSLERANQFNIQGVTFRLVQGVVKNIIPAVASTNAVIAAVCASEVFKLATSCCTPLNNFMVFNDIDGIYTYAYEAEKKDNCTACSNIPQLIDIEDPYKMKLKDLIDYLCESVKVSCKITRSVSFITAYLEKLRKYIFLVSNEKSWLNYNNRW